MSLESPSDGQVAKVAELRLRHLLVGHEGVIRRIAWSPDGKFLASPAGDGTIRIWAADTGECLRVLRGHEGVVYSAAWAPDGRQIVSGGEDGLLNYWNPISGKRLHSVEFSGWVNCLSWSVTGLLAVSHGGSLRLILDRQTIQQGWVSEVNGLAWSPDGQRLAGGSSDHTVTVWKWDGSRLIAEWAEYHAAPVFSVAWSPDGHFLASGAWDETIGVWSMPGGQGVAALEAPLGGRISSVSFSHDGELLASRGERGSTVVWEWRHRDVLYVQGERSSGKHSPSLAFSPSQSLLAFPVHVDKSLVVVAVPPPAVRTWEKTRVRSPSHDVGATVHYTTGKVMLVGDSGVGKTGLGWRLAHGEFKEHPSTHGQQFWRLAALDTKRQDGTECEAVLWDLAGQPDYRLIHSLFLDDADLALVLFDPTDRHDPLRGVEFWLHALPKKTQVILVGARIDRGDLTLSTEEVEAFCREHGIAGGYVGTSARRGDGLEELLSRMKRHVRWDAQPAVTTTHTFKRIKDDVLAWKEEREESAEVLVSPERLRHRLEAADPDFTDDEMMTAVRHLSNHGYVQVLRTAAGEQAIFLAPELLNNLAASFILEARRNPKGLGALEEDRVLTGDYSFPELEGLSPQDRSTLLDAATVLFLEHNVCFRETHGDRSLLIFPELIQRKKPRVEDESATVEGDSYTVTGAVQNVYAALVVLLGYTNIFRRTEQWQDQARYELGEGEACGFRHVEAREGEIDLLLYYGQDTPEPTRRLFQGLFERFLAGRRVQVVRFPPVACQSCGYTQERSVVVNRTRQGRGFLFCSECGEKNYIPTAGEPVSLTQDQERVVYQERKAADQRTRFEAILVRVKALVEERREEAPTPTCFISYAWGDPEHERWVERNLATDLRNAGIDVILDRWHNAAIGSSIPRFVTRLDESDWVVAVGSPLYREKVENEDPARGKVAAAEADLFYRRMTGTEEQKKSVLPILREGEETQALPPLLQGRVHADLRDDAGYFSTLLGLILTIYRLPFEDPVVAEWRDTLQGPGWQ